MDIPEHGRNKEYKKSLSLNLFHFFATTIVLHTSTYMLSRILR